MPGALGSYAAALLRSGSVGSTRLHRAESAAEFVARAIQQDPLQLYALASEKAAAAGLCHRSNNPVCSTQAVVQWAQSVVLSKQKLLQLSGALKLYTKALAGLIPIQNEQHNWAAAAEVARYLGQDPDSLYQIAAVHAQHAGYCLHSSCTVSDVQVWANRDGQNMKGDLGMFARAFGSKASREATMPGGRTAMPTALPSAQPSGAPSLLPTAKPSHTPTSPPSFAPTALPQLVANPMPHRNVVWPVTTVPTAPPTEMPSTAPTLTPTLIPSSMPTSVLPTQSGETNPPHTKTPSHWPTYIPSPLPTGTPTFFPSQTPSAVPTDLPSNRWPTHK